MSLAPCWLFSYIVINTNDIGGCVFIVFVTITDTSNIAGSLLTMFRPFLSMLVIRYCWLPFDYLLSLYSILQWHCWFLVNCFSSSPHPWKPRESQSGQGKLTSLDVRPTFYDVLVTSNADSLFYFVSHCSCQYCNFAGFLLVVSVDHYRWYEWHLTDCSGYLLTNLAILVIDRY